METEESICNVPYQQLDSRKLLGQLSCSKTASVASDGSQVIIWLINYNSFDESKVLHTYVLNEFWQAAVHIKQNVFENLLTKICSLDLYGSFGTFWVKIGQIFDPLSFFEYL